MSQSHSEHRHSFSPRILAPFGVLVAFIIAFTCMLYPMLNMSSKNVPFVIASLDEGVSNAGIDMNVGDQMVENLTSTSNTSDDKDDRDDSPIAWTVLDSQEELDKAMDSNDYYGAVVTPKDFTAKQLAAKQAETKAVLQQAQAQQALQQKLAQAKAQGATPEQLKQMQAEAADQAQQSAADNAQQSSNDEESDGAHIEIITNGAKNPTVTQTLVTQISAQMAKAGVNVTTKTVHDHDLGNSTGASTIAQASVIPTVMLSAISMVVMFLMTRPRAEEENRVQKAGRFGLQFMYAVLLSACVSGVACYLMGVVGGFTVQFGTLFMYLWMCSLCIMTLILGLLTLALPLGVLGIATLMCSMSCAYVAPEMMPQAWADWVNPWSPARIVVDGLRSIVYLGEGAFNTNLAWLTICAAIGLIAAATAVCLPPKRPAAALSAQSV